MVGERLTDGVRIGQLLASEIAGNEGRLRNLAVADADPDVEPTPDGALAYRVVRGGEGSGADGDEVKAESEESERDLVAEAYVQPDRLRIEFVTGAGRSDGSGLPAVAADAAESAGLRVRPKASGRRGRWCSSRTARR